MKQEQRTDGQLLGVVGSTRSGKTAGEKQRIGQAPRALVWDVRGEWIKLPGWRSVRTIPELARALSHPDVRKGRARIAFWGRVEDFDAFCGLAYRWIILWPAEILIDEVSDVTRPGKAEGNFGELIRKGLYYGANICCASQRPQGTSTDLWGNASVLRIYWLRRPGDQEYMADLAGIPLQAIQSIPAPADVDAPRFVQHVAGEPGYQEGALTF